MRKEPMKMNLQFFAEQGAGAGNGSAAAGENGDGAGTGGQAGANTGTQPQFDYEKLAGLIAGKTSVTEDTVLKSYFKQQGLSQEEMAQAIQEFKAQKAANQPDINAMQTQLTQAQEAARQAQLQSAATMAAVGLGMDAKTIPYVLKMADLSQVMGQDGKVNEDALKNALNKVLEDVPALKPQASGQNGSGFVQVGSGSGGQQSQNQEAALKAAFGLK